MKKFYFSICYILLSMFSVESMATTIKNLTITGHPFMGIVAENLSFKNENDLESKLRSELMARYNHLKGLYVRFLYNNKPLKEVDIDDRNKFPDGSHITFEYKDTKKIVENTVATVEKYLKEDNIMMAEKAFNDFVVDAKNNGYEYLVKFKMQNMKDSIEQAKKTSESYKEIEKYRQKNIDNKMLLYATEELAEYEPYIRQQLQEDNPAEARRVFDSLKEAMKNDNYFNLVEKKMDDLEKEIMQKEKILSSKSGG